MAARISDIMGVLFRWYVAGTQLTVTPLAIGSFEEMSALPPVVGSDPPSSSSAVVPVQPPAVGEQRIAAMLRELYGSGAQTNPLFLAQLSTCDVQAIDSLVERRLVNVEYTEFLEQRVSLNMDRLCRISNIVLSRPVAATRCDLGGGLFSQPKLHHMIRLREDGWYDGKPAVAYEPGGPQIYREQFSLSLPYFICLRERARIFAKGVPAIQHNQTSNYYRCLLKLSKEELAIVLPQILDKNDAWFAEQLELVGKGGDGGDGSDGSGSDGGARRRRLPNRIEDTPVLPTDVSLAIVRVPWWETEFKRCYVDLYGCRTKIWFDNQSGADGKRRAWANCGTHGCGCLRVVRNSRNWMACALMLWHIHGKDQVGMTKQDHLRFWPEDADVEAALEHAVFEEF